MKCPYRPGTPFAARKYTFVEPCKLRIRREDGRVDLIGYGIGESIAVLEPEIQLLVVPHEKLKEIPMADGSVIIEYRNQFGRDLLADGTAVYEELKIKAKKCKPDKDGYCACREGPLCGAADYSQTCFRCGGNWY